MGVNLGGCNIRMAEHDLYGTEIRSVWKQVSGKRVAEAMWWNFFFYSCSTGGFFDDLPEPQPCHSFATVGDKKGITPFAFEDCRPGRFKVGLEALFCRNSKGNKSFFFSLADDPDKTGREVAAVHSQCDEFWNSQARGVKELQHGIVALHQRRGNRRGSQ